MVPFVSRENASFSEGGTYLTFRLQNVLMQTDGTIEILTNNTYLGENPTELTSEHACPAQTLRASGGHSYVNERFSTYFYSNTKVLSAS